MSPAPRLKILDGGLATTGTAPRLPPASESERTYPVFDVGGSGFSRVLALSLMVHGALIAGSITWNITGEERSAGGSDETIVIEGIDVVLLDQMPSLAAPLAEARAITQADIAEPVAESEIAALAAPEANAVAATTLEVLPGNPAAMTATAPASESAPETGVSPRPGEALPVDSQSAMEVAAEAATRADEAAEARGANSAEARPVAAASVRPVEGIDPAATSSTATVEAEVADEASMAAADTVAPAERVEPAPPLAANAADLADDRRAAPLAGGRSVPEAVERTEPVLETAAVETPPEAEPLPAVDDVARPIEDMRAPKAESTVPTEMAAEPLVQDQTLAPFEDVAAVTPDEIAPEPPIPPKRPADMPAAEAPAKKVETASRPSPSKPASQAEKAARGPTKAKAGAGGSNPKAQGRASFSSYQSKLVAHLRRYRSYPQAARRQRLQGTALVSFTINSGGRVVGVSIARGTGHAVLDREALGMVRRASPFPAIPANLGRSSVTIRAPIRFDVR